MKFLRGQHSIQNHQFADSAVCIGSFDGLHLGHQAILDKLVQVGRNHKLQTNIITFEPLPAEYFRHKQMLPPPFRLYRLPQKMSILGAWNLDYVSCLLFSQNIASCSFEKFVCQLLHKSLCARYIIVGKDFRFGKNKTGDHLQLAKLGQRLGFTVEVREDILFDGQRISSTRIRNALRAGKIALANSMLGRAYTLRGKVVKGEGMGAEITSYATANLDFYGKPPPLQGVFVVKAWVNSLMYFGVANAGCRPTFGGRKAGIEVHIFNCDRQLHGCDLTVMPLKRLRSEKKFSSVQMLRRQISKDIEQSEHYLANITKT